jgi:hydrogenase 3 maturation protease
MQTQRVMEMRNKKMAPDWKISLKARLKGQARIVIMGVGNPLKGDDAAGLLCAEMLLKGVPARERRGVKVLRAYDVPENYTGIIRKFRPTRVIIIDAALAGLKPGDIFILEKTKIAIEEISSHKIPLMVLIYYLEQTVDCKVTVLGIQAHDLSFGAPVTPVIKSSVKKVYDFLAAAIRKP